MLIPQRRMQRDDQRDEHGLEVVEVGPAPGSRNGAGRVDPRRCSIPAHHISTVGSMAPLCPGISLVVGAGSPTALAAYDREFASHVPCPASGFPTRVKIRQRGARLALPQLRAAGGARCLHLADRLRPAEAGPARETRHANSVLGVDGPPRQLLLRAVVLRAASLDPVRAHSPIAEETRLMGWPALRIETNLLAWGLLVTARGELVPPRPSPAGPGPPRTVPGGRPANPGWWRRASCMSATDTFGAAEDV